MGQTSQVKIRPKPKRERCTKIPPSKTTSDSFGASRRKGPKRHETNIKRVVSEKVWSLFERPFSGRRDEEGIWTQYPGDLVAKKHRLCASYFSMDSPSSNARLCSGKRLRDQITTSRGPSPLSTAYIYIYIQHIYIYISLSLFLSLSLSLSFCPSQMLGKCKPFNGLRFL